jgi:hypothetical protein
MSIHTQVIESHEPVALKKPPADSNPARFQTLADLLRDAYGPKRKRLALAEADLKAMGSAPKPDAEHREELLRLAASDRTLERSRELLLLSVERLARHPLAGQVRDFVREVLRQHPAYQSPSLHGVLENLPDAVSIDTAVSALAAQSFAQLQWPVGTSPLRKREVEALRLAAVHCLLIWLRATRGISLDRIQSFLHSACWAPVSGREKREDRILRTLMLARDRIALGIAFSTLEEKVMERTRDAAAARAAEERARGGADRLRSDFEGASTQLESERSRSNELRDQIERERREHEDEKAHMRNNYEELRGRILRRLRQEVTLLDEGLHALRKQPPKVHVMEDHAERAIDGLKGEIERIKGEIE